MPRSHPPLICTACPSMSRCHGARPSPLHVPMPWSRVPSPSTSCGIPGGAGLRSPRLLQRCRLASRVPALVVDPLRGRPALHLHAVNAPGPQVIDEHAVYHLLARERRPALKALRHDQHVKLETVRIERPPVLEASLRGHRICRLTRSHVTGWKARRNDASYNSIGLVLPAAIDAGSLRRGRLRHVRTGAGKAAKVSLRRRLRWLLWQHAWLLRRRRRRLSRSRKATKVRLGTRRRHLDRSRRPFEEAAFDQVAASVGHRAACRAVDGVRTEARHLASGGRLRHLRRCGRHYPSLLFAESPRPHQLVIMFSPSPPPPLPAAPSPPPPLPAADPPAWWWASLPSVFEYRGEGGPKNHPIGSACNLRPSRISLWHS